MAHTTFWFIHDSNMCKREFAFFFGHCLRLGQLHSSLIELPSRHPSSPHRPFYWYQTATSPPPPTLHHCSAPAAGRTAAVQQGRSDITASIRPIACFIYFKQHLVPGQRRTCWVFCWKSPCLRCCPYFP